MAISQRRCDGSFDQLHVWLVLDSSRVFENGGANGAISGSDKSKMAAGRHFQNGILENLEVIYLWNGLSEPLA